MKKVISLIVLSLCVFVACTDLSAKNNSVDAEYVEITDVKASSFSSEKYAPEKISDKSYESWVEGVSGDGVGEWIELTFEKPTAVQFITIKNGFGNVAYYWKNNRLKKAHLVFEGRKEPVNIEFIDTPMAKTYYVGATDKAYSKVRLVIDEIYPGTNEDHDTCISEICINGEFDQITEYGAYTDTKKIAFKCDPETKRMLRGLYELDVGKDKVKENDGILLVERTDPYEGDRYWTEVNNSLIGTQIHGFNPGTGGGRSMNYFAVFLSPDEKHVLVRYYTQSSGVPEYFNSRIKFYVWENKAWKETSNNWDGEIFKPVKEFADKIEAQGLVYNLYVDNDYSSDDISICLNVYEKSNPRIKVSKSFLYNYDSFIPLNDSVEVVAAFGNPEDFENNPNLKEDLKKGVESNAYSNLNIAAGFNNNPAMCEYLIKLGYPLGETGDEYNHATTLEAWKSGKTSTAVRDVLVKNGASFSPQMLVSAMKQEDKKSFDELIDLISDYTPAWNFLCKYEGVNLSLESQKYFITKFIEKGFDINCYLENEKGRKENNIFEKAFYYYKLDLVKFLVSKGGKIPDFLYCTTNGKTPLQYFAVEYAEKSESAANDLYWKEQYQDSIKMSKVFIDYLFSQGCDANGLSNGGKHNILHFIADKKNRINKYDIEMAKLFISKGADVNQINIYGDSPLSSIIDEIGIYEADYEDSANQFIDLLLKNGAIAEYALIPFFKHDRIEKIKGNNLYEEYLGMCKGSGIKDWSEITGGPEDSSLVNVLLKYYDSPKHLYDYYIKFFMNKGYKYVPNNICAYNTHNQLLINLIKNDSRNEHFDIIKMCVQQDSGIDKSLLNEMLYSYVAAHCYYSPDYYVEGVQFLVEAGADFRYEIVNKSGKTENVLQYLVDFSYLSKDDYEKYAQVCRYFISKGAGDVITKEALKKAKKDKKVIQMIFE